MKSWILVIAALFLLALGDAWARPPWVGNGPRHTERSVDEHPRRRALSLDEAAAQVGRETGGRILSARTLRENGRLMHRIKVLTPEHRVRVIEIDAGER